MDSTNVLRKKGISDDLPENRPGRSPEGLGASLGIYASIASPGAENAPPGAAEDIENKTRSARLRRYKLQNAARALLPKMRIAKCMRTRYLPMVEGWKERERKRAYYRGLVVCASGWMCPICAAKITEHRRRDLQECIDKAYALGFMVWLMTITLQHTRDDKYKNLVDDLRAAWRRVLSGKGWQTLKEQYKIVGLITSLEFTVSIENGGHPHLHILVFSKLSEKEFDCDVFRDAISNRYGDILKKHFKRYASPVYGVDVRVGDDKVGDYIAKFGVDKQDKESGWTLAHEMTKGIVKSGLVRGEHYTPFQLLGLYLDSKDKQAGAMFIEYAKAIKGKHQIGGLSAVRKMLGLSDSMTDEAISKMDEPGYLFAEFARHDWIKILRMKKDEHGEVIHLGDQRGEIEAIMAQTDYATFRAYLIPFGILLPWKDEDPK